MGHVLAPDTIGIINVLPKPTDMAKIPSHAMAMKKVNLLWLATFGCIRVGFFYASINPNSGYSKGLIIDSVFLLSTLRSVIIRLMV